MKTSSKALQLIQLLVLLIVPLDAFALAGGRVNGGTRQGLQGWTSQRKVGASRRSIRKDSTPVRAEAANDALALSGGGEDGEAVTRQADKSTMSQSIFNLAKNIMGAGMLSLPSGVAAFSDARYELLSKLLTEAGGAPMPVFHRNQLRDDPIAFALFDMFDCCRAYPSVNTSFMVGNAKYLIVRGAIVPASAIIAALGALSAYTFCLMGRLCSQSKAESYEQAWARTVGGKSAWLPAGSCVATCFAGCLAYTIIIGDSFSALAKAFGAPPVVASRSNIIFALSATVLLPLSLLKNLKSLGFTSMLGTSGLLYTAVMMGIRFFDGSYAPGGRFHALVPAGGAPVFGVRGANPIRFLVLVSMLATAYEAHFNAPLFYRELHNNTVPRYTRMVSASFLASVLTMTAVTAFGFLTFGGASSGYILNNYANSDRLAALARIFVATSIVFSYPLCFVGLRDGIREMRGVMPEETKGRTAWTVGLLGLTTAVSIVLTDLGFVNSFCGALIGSGIIYIFPSLMFLKPLRDLIRAGTSKLTHAVRREMVANNAIVVTGVVMGILGAAVSVLETFTNVLG